MIKTGLYRAARCALVAVMILALVAVWVPRPVEASGLGIATGAGIAVGVGVPMLLAWLGITEDKAAPEGPSYFSDLVSKATDFLADAGYISAGLLSTSVAISNPGAVTGMSVVPVPLLQKLNEWLFTEAAGRVVSVNTDIAASNDFTVEENDKMVNFMLTNAAFASANSFAIGREISFEYANCLVFGTDLKSFVNGAGEVKLKGKNNYLILYNLSTGVVKGLTTALTFAGSVALQIHHKAANAALSTDKPITTGNLCAPGVDVGSISAGGVITAPYPPGAGSDTEDPDKPIGWVPVNPNAWGSQADAQAKTEVDVVVDPDPTTPDPTTPDVVPGDTTDNPGVLEALLTRLMQPLVDTFKPLFDTLVAGFQAIAEPIYKPIVTAVSSAAEFVVNGVQSLAGAIWQPIVSAVEAVGEFVISGVKSIFVPSEDFVTAKVDALRAKFSLFDSLYSSGSQLVDKVKALSSGSPPQVWIDLGAATNGRDYGGKMLFVDLSWYAAYKAQIDLILGGFLWACYLWRMFKRLPELIHGAGDDVKFLDSHAGSPGIEEHKTTDLTIPDWRR